MCADGDALRSYLNSLLAPYEEEYKNDGNVTVGFNKTVLLEDGIYFNDSFEDDNSIEDMISGVRQQEKTYTVQTGDTLWSIAQKNDLTFRELCALNTNFKGAALTEGSNIQEGDTLIVTKVGSHAGSAHHQDRDPAGGNPLHHRDHPVERIYQGHDQNLAGG